MTVVLSTHLDDAVLSVFSLLRPGTTVVTVLAGFPPPGTLADWDRITGAVDSHQRVADRRAEDLAAIAPTGAQVVHLDLADEQYAAAGLLPEPTPAALSDALRPLVAAGDLLAPAGIGNRDHQRVRDAALAVRPDSVLYADLPYALRDGWELPLELPSREPHDVMLEAVTLAAKLAAFRRYETQVSQLVADFGDFVTEDGLGRERTWRPGV